MELFGKRFCAYMIDTFILIVLVAILKIVVNMVTDVNPLFFNIFTLVISFSYFILMEASSMQATFGKRFMGLIVCDMEGERISYGKAFLRNISRLINLVICGLGYLPIIFTARNQGLHDFIGRTLVISEEDLEENYDEYDEEEG